MKLLALDTATEACSAALWLDGQMLSRFERVGRSHTQALPAMVHALMAEGGCAFTQLDGLVSGVGPGSFAGVRIAVSYVKGMALALDRPVLGVSSLAMLAQGQIAAGASEVLAAIDARMNEVYWGHYRANAQSLAQQVEAERVCAPDAVPPVKVSAVATGSGWGSYEAALRAACSAQLVRVEAQALPAAAEALQLALPAWTAQRFHSADQLEPTYLRNKVALTLAEQQELRDNSRRSAPALRDGKP